MVEVPGWAAVSSVSAPVLLIGGWTVAATRQRGGFDPVRESISALAGLDADDRWLMTAALTGVGLCHLVTAAGLRPAATSGRVLLGLGGAGTLAVAACPLPADYGSFAAHGVAAGVAFGALACWPVLSTSGPDRSAGPVTRRPAGRRLPFGLRRPVALAAGGLLLGLLGWFVSQLDGPVLGLSERVAAGAQALWPAVVVLTCLVHRPAAPDDDPATRGDGPSARRLWITPAVE